VHEILVLAIKCHDYFVYLVWVEFGLTTLHIIAEVALLVDKVEVAVAKYTRANPDNRVVISGLWGPDEVVLFVAKSKVL